jgi:hypothetical protein
MATRDSSAEKIDEEMGTADIQMDSHSPDQTDGVSQSAGLFTQYSSFIFTSKTVYYMKVLKRPDLYYICVCTQTAIYVFRNHSAVEGGGLIYVKLFTYSHFGQCR